MYLADSAWQIAMLLVGAVLLVLSIRFAPDPLGDHMFLAVTTLLGVIAGIFLIFTSVSWVIVAGLLS